MALQFEIIYSDKPQGIVYAGCYEGMGYVISNWTGHFPWAYIRIPDEYVKMLGSNISDYSFLKVHGGVGYTGYLHIDHPLYNIEPGFYVGWHYCYGNDYSYGDSLVLDRHTTDEIRIHCKQAIHDCRNYINHSKGEEKMNGFSSITSNKYRIDFSTTEEKKIEPIDAAMQAYKNYILYGDNYMFVGGRGGGKTLSMAQMMAANYIRSNSSIIPRIEKIIVNGNHTIVIWEDGTKTIVKPSENDNYDLDAAVCAAITKKIFGSNSALKREIKKKTVYQKSKKNKKEDKDDVK